MVSQAKQKVVFESGIEIPPGSGRPQKHAMPALDNLHRMKVKQSFVVTSNYFSLRYQLRKFEQELGYRFYIKCINNNSDRTAICKMRVWRTE